jgi:hypothetical protein
MATASFRAKPRHRPMTIGFGPLSHLTGIFGDFFQGAITYREAGQYFTPEAVYS